MATWKKITTEAELSAVSASLTTTDKAISSSVVALSSSLTTTDQAISASVATLSGSASDARNKIASGISGSTTALSASLTSTDQAISSSVASLSGSASDARNVLFSGLSGSASDARNELVTKISGSSTAAIAALSSSLTVTDQAISSSVASLSGSASDARNQIAAGISGSTTALSASLTVTDQAISSSVASLSGSASAARDAIVSDISGAFDISFTSTTQGEIEIIKQGILSTLDLADLKDTSDPTFNDLQVNGTATIEGDLTVKGTTTTVQSTNLLVSDKFALFASGSTAATDGGLIIQAAADGSGKALGYSQANSRWSLQASLDHDATTFSSIDAFLGTIETSVAVPTTAPVYGVGTMHIKTDTEDIYIYS